MNVPHSTRDVRAILVFGHLGMRHLRQSLETSLRLKGFDVVDF